MLEVVFGRRVLGYLPPLSLAARPGPGGLVVLLAGRAWDVLDIDWQRKRVLVAASEMKGRSRWNSGGRTMSFPLARAHHDVVAGEDPPTVALSQRATGKLAELRAAHAFAAPGSADRTYLVPDSSGRPVWWTFAGFRANSALLDGLPKLAGDDSAGCRRPRTRVAEVLRRGTGAAGPRDGGRADGRRAGRRARRRSTGESRQRAIGKAAHPVREDHLWHPPRVSKHSASIASVVSARPLSAKRTNRTRENASYKR